MANLSLYRLNSISEIIDLQHHIGKEKFYKYLNMVYKLAKSITLNQKYLIEQHVKKANQKVFVKCLCLYICESGSECNIEFSNDYSTVLGIQSINEYKEEALIIRKRINKFKKDGKETE